ncbi:hypothetical protein FG386_001423 [Cryptosporidium ryanae]|uniref:uncharacterized protein n=1 Tax=Cryptosporidium ryanae TaxID=515981 RepID=UPI00351A924B|nr:hypothetical protein FG386_001423 [Cryptosporidium ryanae]
MAKLLFIVFELAFIGGCLGAGYLSRTGNIARSVVRNSALGARFPEGFQVAAVKDDYLKKVGVAAQIKLAEEQRKRFAGPDSRPSLPRLDRASFGSYLFAPSDLSLAGVEEAWDERMHQVVVQTDGEVSSKVKGKLRLEFLRKRGFSARAGSLEEIHALRISPGYHPEKYMLNYPGGKLTVPTHDADGKPLPKEHVSALMARATQFDSQTMLGPYPSTFGEMEKVRIASGIPGMSAAFVPGMTGMPGYPGFAGDKGSRFGPLGPVGAMGPMGALGSLPVSGPIGAMGPMGAPGSLPVSGPIGAMGPSGVLSVSGPVGGALGVPGAGMGYGRSVHDSVVSGVGPGGIIKSGLYMPGSFPKIRQYLDESNPKNPFLVVWDPSKLSADLQAPADMNPVHERFRKVKTGGHQMWISSKSRNAMEVQGRATDLASRGYRVFITPPITMIPTSGMSTATQIGSSIEGKLLVEKTSGLWPLTAVRFSGGDLVVEAIGWQGARMLPPLLAESVRILQHYRPQRIIIRDISNNYWHLVGPYKVSMIPGYKLPEKASGVPSFPSQAVLPGKGPLERTSRFRRHSPVDSPFWGRSAADAGPINLPRSERHGSTELGRVLPVKPSGLFRDTNECLALQQYGREPYKFGLLPTLGSGKLYDMAAQAALKTRERGTFAFVEDFCLALRILVVMYDEMRNDLQCNSVVRATAILKNEPGLDDFIRREICIAIFNTPTLPSIDLRPLNLALMNPGEIANHYNLRTFPKVSPYTSRIFGAAIHKSDALQDAIASSPLSRGIDEKIYRDVCSEVSYTLQELNPYENSSAQQCVQSIKAVFGLHVSEWEDVTEDDLIGICEKSGYKSLPQSEISRTKVYDYKTIRSLFYLSKDHAVYRPYLLAEDFIIESKTKTNPAWCKAITPEGNCVATDLARNCDGLSAIIVNRAQLFAYYSEQVQNKLVKGSMIPMNTNTVCSVFSEMPLTSESETEMADILSQKLGSVFPIFKGEQALTTLRGFFMHEKKIMSVKKILTIFNLYSRPMKYISGSDKVLIARSQSEMKAENKATQEASLADSSVPTEEESEEDD